MSGDVNSNRVEISAGTVKGDVYGGFSYDRSATKNTVTLSSGTVNGDIYGGVCIWEEARGNQLVMSAGEVKNICGGYSQNGSATGNTVTISGGTITGKVIGGASPDTATGNNIILAKGAAAANLKTATFYGSGDYVFETGLPGTHSGNTLTVEKEKNITVANVKNFEMYDFRLGDVKNGEALLTLATEEATDLASASVKVTVDTNEILSLSKGNTVYLLKKTNGELTNLGKTTGLDHTYTNDAKDATIATTGEVATDGNDLVLNVGDARAHWQGYDLPSPSMKGSTVRFEAGWTFRETPTTPLALDLGISGSTGKERGIAFHAGVNVAF